MAAVELLIFTCANCGQRGSACPDCVTTMAIDPQTGLPPDVAIQGSRVVTVEPSAEARERSRQEPLCDRCVATAIRAGKSGLMTAEDRHRRTHAEG